MTPLERTRRNPACWKKWRRKEKRAKTEASSPVLMNEPATGQRRCGGHLRRAAEDHGVPRVEARRGEVVVQIDGPEAGQAIKVVLNPLPHIALRHHRWETR